jgi:SH3-like domain-containing protein
MAPHAAPSATPTSLPSAPSAGTDQGPHVCGQARISARKVNLRAGPTRNSDVLHRLPQGDVVDLLCDAPQQADEYTWLRVRETVHGQVGWVAAEYLVAVP